MKPSNKELHAATKEEVAAMRQLASDLNSETEAVLKVRASRHRLMLARSAKSALFQDLMSYGEL